MKVSYQWLQDYVKTGLTPERLADRFRLTSSEVDEIDSWGDRFKGLAVGTVEEVRDHPNASRLRIAQVKVGREKRSIVCGAPNLAVGQTVVVAKPGVTIHPLKGEPITIQETVIRGEASQGMLCGADEIGLPIPGDGILVLEDGLTSGSSLITALKLDDWVLDLEITPNRPDLLSYCGLAREVSAFDKRPMQDPPIASLEPGEDSDGQAVSVEIEDSSLCYRYSAIRLDHIRIAASPLWMQLRLIRSGVKPINNVVDITNYCMLEYGQPLHAFDAERLSGTALTVRPARSGESLALLDGSVRSLVSGDILIANGQGEPLALAGIMGGQASAISDATSSILIESATFHGPQIRRTSQRLGLRSEASGRYEKGLDPELTVTVLKRAAYLLREISGAQVQGALADRYPQHGKAERPRIHLSFGRIQEIAGVNISAAECKSILQRLGFQIPSLTKSSFEAIPPSWRKDVTLPEDIVEELIRIWGFERLPSTLPVGAVKPPQPNAAFERKHRIRQILAAAGLHECLHLSLTSAALISRAGLDPQQAVRVPHPLSQEIEYLLPSHLVSLLNNVATVNSRELEVGLFELGKIFFQPNDERETLSLLLRTNQSAEQLFRRAKALCERLGSVLQVGMPSFKPESDTALTLVFGQQPVGEMRLVGPETVSASKLRTAKHLLFIDIDLSQFLSLPPVRPLYVAAPVYPTAERDLTMSLDAGTSFADIAKVIADNFNRDILSSWKVSGIFTGKPLPADRKSVTLHFIYNSAERTLADQEVSDDQKRLAEACRAALSAHITE